MKQTINGKIDALTDAIEKPIARPVAPIAPVLPIAPIAPVAPIVPLTTTSSEDHVAIATLIVSVQALDTKFTEKFADIKSDIKALSDGTASQLADHEKRIRINEQYQQNLIGKLSVIVGSITIAISVIALWIGKQFGL
jgi:hypothetical protein